MVGWKIARLGIYYDTGETDLDLITPENHIKFGEPVAKPQALFQIKQIASSKDLDGVLTLRLRDEPIDRLQNGVTRLYASDTWEFWLEESGSYVFLAPHQSPQCKMVVDPNFTAGELIGDFNVEGGEGFFPVWNLEIRLFSAWLASFWDVILHASGVKVDGKGYAFLGDSGAGKSTLAAALALDPSVTVLGEDQVILRFLEGRFWIFGAPWHLDPTMCSPEGVPLEKLFFLDRNQEPGVHEVSPLNGVTRLLQTAFIPYYRPEWLPGILERFERLAETVPFFLLSYQLGTDPWQSIQKA
jgi:hypothetical protein